MCIKKFKVFCSIVLLPGILVLSGCHSGNDKAKKQVANLINKIEHANLVKKPDTNDIEKKITPYIFEADKGRNPFEIGNSVASKNKKNFSDTVLSNVSIDNMQLVGTLVKHANSWAMIRVGDGKLYRITKGAHLGVQEALVFDILQNEVVLHVETESDGKEKTSNVVLRMQE